MNKLSTEKRTQTLSCLVEGNSLRPTAIYFFSLMMNIFRNAKIKMMVPRASIISNISPSHHFPVFQQRILPVLWRHIAYQMHLLSQ